MSNIKRYPVRLDKMTNTSPGKPISYTTTQPPRLAFSHAVLLLKDYSIISPLTILHFSEAWIINIVVKNDSVSAVCQL